MKFLKRVIQLSSLLCVVGLTAVLFTTNSKAQETHQIFLPHVQTPATEIVISDSTKVVTEETEQHLISSSEDLSTLVFSQMTEDLTDLKPGDILVSGITDKTPDGYLRQVVTIEKSDGYTTLGTVQAALDDFVEEGDLHVSQTLTSADIDDIELAEGVTLDNSRDVQGNKLRLNINNVVLLQSGGQKVTAFGSLTLDPRYDLDVSVRFGSLKELKFVVDLKEEVDIGINANLDLNSRKVSKKITTLKSKNIKVIIGGVPVVFKVTMPIYLHLDGSLSAGIEAKVNQSANVKAGLQYKNGNWSTIRSFSKSFSFSLNGQAEANLTLTAEVPVILAVYGVKGPYVSTEPHLRARTSVDIKHNSPLVYDVDFSLYAGIDIDVGVKIKALGRTLVDVEKEIYENEWHLRTWEWTVGTYPTPTPPPTATPGPTSTPRPTSTPGPTPTQVVGTSPSSGRYGGVFNNTIFNAGGSVLIDMNVNGNSLSGYINFTGQPGPGFLCGAGNFTGTRSGNNFTISFTSNDPDPDCGSTHGLRFTVSGTFSGNRIINGTYSVSNSQAGTFFADRTTRYTGRFNNANGASGIVVIDLALTSTTSAGYINFTNDPGNGALCGAGPFAGSRSGNSVQFSFESNDTDAGCTFDYGLRFDMSSSLSSNRISGSYNLPTFNQGGTFWANK